MIGIVFLTWQSFVSLSSPLVPQGRGSVPLVFATSLCSGLLTRTAESELGAADTVFIVSAAVIGPVIQMAALPLSRGH